jgi:hypothetical protein
MLFNGIPSGRRRLQLLFAGALLSAPVVAQAQTPGTLPIQPIRMDSALDSTRAAMPASHRDVARGVDQPVKLKHCPPPAYPRTPFPVYGYPIRVAFVFVVDTLGMPEMDDIVVQEATDPGFLPSAKRAISKCRYEPARLNGHPVRFLVQQAVTYAVDPEWRGEVTRWREDRAR